VVVVVVPIDKLLTKAGFIREPLWC